MHYVYWTNAGTSTIGRANVDGSGADQRFITDTSSPQGFPQGMAVDAGHIYWSNAGAGTNAIARANLDGSGINPKLYHRRSVPTGHSRRRRPHLLGKPRHEHNQSCQS